jgi:hypothetical protein
MQRRFHGLAAARRLTPAQYALETYNAKTMHTDRVRLGEFDTGAEAVTAAKALIDEQLRGAIDAGRSFESAYREWLALGRVPSIVAIRIEAHQVEFDPFSYAASQAQEIAEFARAGSKGRTS